VSAGSSTLEAIRASARRESSPQERLDPNNGLPLVASLDDLLDAGLISFDSFRTLIVSRGLNASAQQLIAVTGRSLQKMPPSVTARYLDYQHGHVLRG
jgi:putative restriction endonuclease